MTILDPSDAVPKAARSGRPPMFDSMRVVRDDGTDCAPGEVGETVGRGPTLMHCARRIGPAARRRSDGLNRLATPSA